MKKMPDSKIVYQFKGKDMALRVSRTRLPNNRWIDLQMITHPGAVCIVPFLKSGQIILLRQFRPAINAYHFELPAGTLDEKENPLTCARRELKEETGYTAKRWTRKGRIYPLPAYSDEQIIIYQAEGLTLAQSAPEEYEIIEVLVMTVPQIRSLFSKGKIIDAKTICALTFCGVL